jgi:signal transduction histidine kinase
VALAQVQRADRAAAVRLRADVAPKEALHNVERHAQAQSVRIELRALPGANAAARVTVIDDGIGFDTTVAHPGHYGLLGMREQAALIGAMLDIRSAPGEGTTIGLEFTA